MMLVAEKRLQRPRTAWDYGSSRTCKLAVRPNSRATCCAQRRMPGALCSRNSARMIGTEPAARCRSKKSKVFSLATNQCRPAQVSARGTQAGRCTPKNGEGPKGACGHSRPRNVARR
jgi:hypothetical protein